MRQRHAKSLAPGDLLVVRTNSPQCRVAALLCFLFLIVLSPVGAADRASKVEKPGWAETITIDQPHAEVRLLEIAFGEIVAAGMNPGAAAKLLKHVGEYVDSEVAERGTAIMSLGMLEDAVAATQSEKWSIDDTSRFVVALQRDLNQRHADEKVRLQALIERVNHGSKPDQMLGSGETLKEPATPPLAEVSRRHER